jgi:hypothetical protein
MLGTQIGFESRIGLNSAGHSGRPKRGKVAVLGSVSVLSNESDVLTKVLK